MDTLPGAWPLPAGLFKKSMKEFFPGSKVICTRFRNPRGNGAGENKVKLVTQGIACALAELSTEAKKTMGWAAVLPQVCWLPCGPPFLCHDATTTRVA